MQGDAGGSGWRPRPGSPQPHTCLPACLQEKERRKAEAKAKRGALRELLERSAWVRFDTPWRKAQDRLAGA